MWGPGINRTQTEMAIAGNWRQLFPGTRLPNTIANQAFSFFLFPATTGMRMAASDACPNGGELADTYLVVFVEESGCGTVDTGY